MIVLAAVSLLIWIYLFVAHGMFWRLRERDERCQPVQDPTEWPSVTAIVPARDEADVIAGTLATLLAQNYPGPFHIVVVDDRSSDATAAVARQTAIANGCADRVDILAGEERPAGWSGKVWAMQQGFAHIAGPDAPDYLLFTDADIAHSPDNLRCLVAHAENGRLALVSLMAKLHCETAGEKLLIPAFVYFFAMLFPFGWVNDRTRRTAAAAGGCMLVRREALIAAGGLAAIAGAIIDDCALAAILKRQGPLWLGVTLRALSVRPYGSVAGIERMVARSAYAQLHYSPALLCGTLAAMLVVYAAPMFLGLFAHDSARLLGIGAWLLMAVTYQPVLRFYRQSPLWGMALPAIGALYAGFTLDSALRYWRGRGGMWKGRAQAIR